MIRSPERAGSRTLRAAHLTWLLTTLALAGCGSDLPEFDAALPVDRAALERQNSGLWIQVAEEGSGDTAEPGDTAVVHYTGWLPGGRSFDSSRERGQPFSFPLGQGRVIQGWDEGVAGMRQGERRILVIPPELGYGERGAGGVIPPGAWLVFDVELLEVR
ncbi:MAG: hypothetical protein GWM92_10400 [Gemmatimonadetes bacterium]|nr:FKBP-type peptidyl-prolyl cis-trans isomerase [Gemmatimonadota bacterium]NIR79093.1 FKBP-type peptidyl-prolyl cis-trans isomerase [Gemmatimonadota bacterium]NIT87752.1 FKBP-type peptidyl-prolyl cis-trans isomerase [Gemmatimonadota bacterium]NIU31612.1 FKBP-type peptidyl-prolyl cis-trans isomerase [Gemmatimonadota bacterium]NIU36246.1 hypothetical protein [Gemmatimonadota bacterium]